MVGFSHNGKQVLRQREWREVTPFLMTTFVMTWLLWFGAYSPFANSAYFTMAGTTIPSVAGLMFTAMFGGKPKIKELLRAAVHFKAPLIWWLFATMLFPAILLFACTVFVVIGGSVPSAQFPLGFLPIAFFYIFICMGPLGEEFGWRGFLLKRFLQKWSVMKAGLLTGLIWSAWHLPLFLISGTIQQELVKMGFLIALAGYFLYTVCMSLLMSVLYARTEGNLLLCMVFHTTCNVSLGVAPIILTKDGALVLLISLSLVTFFVTRVGLKNTQERSALSKSCDLSLRK